MAELESGILPGLDGTPAGEPVEGKKRGRPKGSTNKVTLEKLERDIADAIGGEIAGVWGVASPLGGYILTERADRTASALIRIASKNPRFLNGLRGALSASDYLALAVLPAALAVAMAVDMGMLKPDSIASDKLGVQAAWQYCYGESGSEHSPNGSGEVSTIRARGMGAEL